MSPPTLTDRLRRHVTGRFDAAVLARLEAYAAEDSHDGPGLERVLAAILLVAGPDASRLDAALDLARADRRDVLVASGLADDDWRTRLDRFLD